MLELRPPIYTPPLDCLRATIKREEVHIRIKLNLQKCIDRQKINTSFSDQLNIRKKRYTELPGKLIILFFKSLSCFSKFTTYWKIDMLKSKTKGLSSDIDTIYFILFTFFIFCFPSKYVNVSMAWPTRNN